MSETYVWRDCPDCGAKKGEPHDPGCDVERCKVCGWQAIGCDCPDDTPPTIWRGSWPGEIEVAEGLATDLNDLARRHAQGFLRWDRDAERLVHTPPAPGSATEASACVEGGGE